MAAALQDHLKSVIALLGGNANTDVQDKVQWQ